LLGDLLEDSMTRFVVGDDRSQSTLFPERLDDYLNPVRAVEVFVDSLMWRGSALTALSRRQQGGQHIIRHNRNARFAEQFLACLKARVSTQAGPRSDIEPPRQPAISALNDSMHSNVFVRSGIHIDE
jgi:hypothetical protein